MVIKDMSLNDLPPCISIVQKFVDLGGCSELLFTPSAV